MSDGFLKEVAMPPKAAKQHAERAVQAGTNFLLGRAKVASGKFLCVGDRRNRENCERT